ncbi:VOC family protein [Ktedonospora formicarum]|uniref:VOC domain-containing protein n=1 Tax=Ktedonospora formicarum TaxID=2778364 RepID=A0A8J3I546_9CHLR|nr:VOC family protein [Ktedonospora formicarum]GHO46860.1 hypothetical protein KSX_50230 [Ktedonospora formicarum]
MKLTYIPLRVTDFPAAVHFWSKVAKLPLTYSDENGEFASFDTGSVTLLLIGSKAVAKAGGDTLPIQPHAQSLYLSFQVDDVDKTYADLIAGGATSVYSPQDFSDLQARQAHIMDSDGHLIEIYQPLVKV